MPINSDSEILQLSNCHCDAFQFSPFRSQNFFIFVNKEYFKIFFENGSFLFPMIVHGKRAEVFCYLNLRLISVPEYYDNEQIDRYN